MASLTKTLFPPLHWRTINFVVNYYIPRRQAAVVTGKSRFGRVLHAAAPASVAQWEPKARIRLGAGRGRRRARPGQLMCAPGRFAAAAAAGRVGGNAAAAAANTRRPLLQSSSLLLAIFAACVNKKNIHIYICNTIHTNRIGSINMWRIICAYTRRTKPTWNA